MNARDEIREQIRTRLVGYVDTSDAEAVRLLDAFAAEVLVEAADAVTADLDRQGGDATGQYAVGMKRAAFLVRRRADQIGGA